MPVLNKWQLAEVIERAIEVQLGADWKNVRVGQLSLTDISTDVLDAIKENADERDDRTVAIVQG